MKVLVVEDDAAKATVIKDVILANCEAGNCDVKVASNLNEAFVTLGGCRFDLVVADLMLPQMGGSADTQDATPQWCEYIENHPGARLSSWIVMTSFSEVASDARRNFAQLGVAVIEYDETSAWRRILTTKVREQFVNPSLDFVIMCALEKERGGYVHSIDIKLGAKTSTSGLDCQRATIGALNGQIIVMPEPGLVSAAIATVKASAVFKPRAVLMTGICGGVLGESELGDLIVPDISWNYQSGKFVNGILKPELMQTPIPPLTKTALQQLATDEISTELRAGLFQNDLRNRKIVMPPMVSGSQVVADKKAVAEISGQSRKVGALDMEVAAVYNAAHDFFNGGGIFFAAKTVVDLADEAKDDRYHEYGCALSARFAVRALAVLLK